MSPLPTRASAPPDSGLTELAFGAASIGNLYRATTDDEASGAVTQAWEMRDPLLRHRAALRARPLGASPGAGPVGLPTRRVRRVHEGRAPARAQPEPDRSSTMTASSSPATFGECGTSPATECVARWTTRCSRLGTGPRGHRLRPRSRPVQQGCGATKRSRRWPSFGRRESCAPSASGPTRADQLAELFRDGLLDVAMLAGRYTLLEQGGLADSAGAGPGGARVGSSPSVSSTRGCSALRGPLLMPGTNTRQPLPRSSLAPVGWRHVCERHGVTLPDAAIAFPLLHPAVSSVAWECAAPSRYVSTSSDTERGVPDELWADLVAADLIDRSGPVVMPRSTDFRSGAAD